MDRDERGQDWMCVAELEDLVVVEVILVAKVVVGLKVMALMVSMAMIDCQ